MTEKRQKPSACRLDCFNCPHPDCIAERHVHDKTFFNAWEMLDHKRSEHCTNDYRAREKEKRARNRILYAKDGARLRAWRKAQGMTREQFATRCGFGVTKLTSIENGACPMPDDVRKLAGLEKA